MRTSPKRNHDLFDATNVSLILRRGVLGGLLAVLALTPSRADAQVSRADAQVSRADAQANPLVRRCVDNAERMVRTRAEREANAKMDAFTLRQILGGAKAFGECRAELVRKGQPASLFAQSARIAIKELDHWADPLLLQVEAARKAANEEHGEARRLHADDTNNAESMVRLFLESYEAVAPSSPKLAKYRSRFEGIQAANRSREERDDDSSNQAFAEWRANVTAVFEQDWAAITRADEAARPLFEEGKQALEQGNPKLAVTKLLAARAAAYAGRLEAAERADRLSALHAIDTGIAEQISLSLLGAYQAEKLPAGIVAELKVLKQSRPLFSHDDELGIYLNEVDNGGLSERQLHLPKKGPDAAHFKDFHGVQDPWIHAAMMAHIEQGRKVPDIDARLAQVGGGYRLNDERWGAKELVGKLAVIDGTIGSVSGGRLTFDLRGHEMRPYDCHETSRVDRIDPVTGRVEYHQDCNKTYNAAIGYLVSVDAPTGLRSAKKNRVELYGTISSVDGDRVKLTNAVLVKVLPPGEENLDGVRPIIYMSVPVAVAP
jgi:hypothetical protein